MQAVELNVGKQGRIVIPASLRHELAIQAGSQLIAHVENGRLIMETKQQLWKSLHQLVSAIPDTVDLAEELIAERREAAKQEEA